MRISKYSSNDDNCCEASVRIDFVEHEIGIIDNALYAASRTDEYKDDKEFLAVYTAFHLLREIVNHGHVGSDDIYFAHSRYKELGKYKLLDQMYVKKKSSKSCKE